MKKILVTGAGGFIGGHLVKELLNRGYLVRATDIKPFDEWYQCFEKVENLIFDALEQVVKDGLTEDAIGKFARCGKGNSDFCYSGGIEFSNASRPASRALLVRSDQVASQVPDPSGAAVLVTRRECEFISRNEFSRRLQNLPRI